VDDDLHAQDLRARALALGFGQHAADAVASTQRSLHGDFDDVQRQYARRWRDYDAQLTAPPHAMSGVSHETWSQLVDEYCQSVGR
jgi:hypothetical protein